MDAEERQEAIFGAFDGTVSVIGFVFGLLAHGSSMATIAVGGAAGAAAATVSMAAGAFESAEGTTARRARDAAAMGISTFLGSLVPVWPFFVFGRTTAILVAAAGCLVVAGWIGWEKRRGARGFVASYVTLLAATGVTLAIVAAIPASAG